MSDTKLEKAIGRIKRICCDWGLARPTAPKNGVFYGNTAPIWRCPSPILLLLTGIFHLLVFISEICVAAYVENFEGDCGSNVVNIRNLTIFMFLIAGAYQFYMSKSSMGTDKQWCRYITLSMIIEAALFLISLSLGFSVADGCQSLSPTTYNIAVSCAILGIICTSVFTATVVYTIVKLYCVGNPLAYNQET